MSLQRHVGVWWMAWLLLPTPSGFTAQDLREPIHQAITRAVDFLAQVQQPDGSFRVNYCLDPELMDCPAEDFSEASWRQTPHSLVYGSKPTAVVLTGLLAVKEPGADGIAERASSWLQAQMDADGMFGYFQVSIPAKGPNCVGEFRQLHMTAANREVLEDFGVSLPPILSSLATYQRSDGTFYPYAIPPSEVEAIKAGGPARERFRQRYESLMQYHGPNMLQRIDIVDPLVNAEVFDYFVRHGHTSAALCDYLVRLAQQEQISTHPAFVRNPHLFPYALSRAYAHGATCLEPAKATLQARLLERQGMDGTWGRSALDTALVAMSLLQFGYTGDELDRAIQHLLEQQQPNGSWARAAWWEVLRWNKKWIGGWLASEEVSTGYALEALGQYLKVRGRATTL